ncbi:hypothetical protein GN244_ATG15035 [Phytophthora infestans]|nr:hypothetical protein GN244_ATG15035 [Phytophthora infestans]
MEVGEEPEDNAIFTVIREILGVKMDELVPGFGKCQTQRSSLVQNDSTAEDTTQGLTLVLSFVNDPDDDLMCEVLGVIGRT